MPGANEISTRSELDLSPIASGTSFITLLFPKSTAKSYPIAVSFAKLATAYREGIWGGKTFHLACFEKNALQVSLARKVCNLIYSLKGTMGFVEGTREVPMYKLAYVLSCYSKSLYAKDADSYCGVISYASNWKMLIPCQLLSGREARINDLNDNSLDKKMQSLAVKNDCDWCPNFKPEKTKFMF